MKTTWLTVSLFFILGSQSPLLSIETTVIDRPTLILGQGEQRILQAPGLASFSLGSPIARAAVRGDELLLKGIHPGRTDLWILNSDGVREHRSIIIEKVSATEIPKTLLLGISALAEVEVLYAGAGVTLRGEFHSLREAARISALVHAHPKEVIDQSVPSEKLLAQAKEKLMDALAKTGLSSKLHVERVASDLWIRGSLASPSDRASVQALIDQNFPRARTEIFALPDQAPTVHFKVFLLELKKIRSHSFGLEWPSIPALQEGAFQITSLGISSHLQLDLALQAMEGNGSARILSKPELVVRAPGEAELFAGGELPVPVRNRVMSNISWKNYGLTLKLNVTHSTAERVRVDIFTEVSHLDTTIGTDQIPGIQANRMKTQVDAYYGSPLLLSGLLQQGTRESAKGLPFLRQIPILGSLFGSEDYLNERSELVAILLPNRTPPPAPMHRVETAWIPKGFAPAPRNWLSLSEIRALQQSQEYPWNALQ